MRVLCILFPFFGSGKKTLNKAQLKNNAIKLVVLGAFVDEENDFYRSIDTEISSDGT